MTARLKWLLCGFAFIFAAFLLWLVVAESRTAGRRASRPAMCEMATLCDVAAPPPVDLHRLALAPDDRDRRLVARAAGNGPIEAYAPEAPRAAPNRLFLVGGTALVIVRGAPGLRRAFLIRRGAGLAALTVRTDADLALARFALLDRASGSGETLVLEPVPRDGRLGFRVLAPDSPEIREEWLAARRSSCGGGPLTAVPAQWLRDYDAACRTGHTGRSGGG